MDKTYSKSFSEQAPEKCPKCGSYFDLNSDDLDLIPSQGGIITRLYCPNDKCDFKMDLSYDTEEDIAKAMEDLESETEDE